MANQFMPNTSICYSPYPSRLTLSDNQRLALATAFTVLTPITLVLNGFLIYGLYKTKQYLNICSRFILVLSISDFCIGSIVQPSVIYLFIEKNEEGSNCIVSMYMTFVAYTFLNMSGVVIFMVSVDRFLRLRNLRGTFTALQ